MFKKSITMMIIIFLFVLSACSKGGTDTPPTDETLPLSIEQISGLEHIEVTQDEYFDPLKGIEVINQLGDNVSYMFEVEGTVDYGSVGTYPLTYKMTYGDD